MKITNISPVLLAKKSLVLAGRRMALSLPFLSAQCYSHRYQHIHMGHGNYEENRIGKYSLSYCVVYISFLILYSRSNSKISDSQGIYTVVYTQLVHRLHFHNIY